MRNILFVLMVPTAHLNTMGDRITFMNGSSRIKCDMMAKCAIWTLLLFTFVLTILSCSGNQPLQTSTLKVFVSIPPQAYLVDQIGGEFVNCEALIKAGQSPVTLDPTVKQLAGLAEADLFFRIGVPFEEQLLPRVRTISKNVTVIDLRSDGDVTSSSPLSTYSNIGHDSHHHSGGDPHIWLDPNQLKTMASDICETLCQHDTVHASIFRHNLDSLLASVENTDTAIRGVLDACQQRRIYVYHAAFEHFCRAYNLTQIAVEEDGKEPSSQALARLMEMARRDQPAAIFVQQQFSSRSAGAIAKSIGADIVELDPLAYDLPKNLAHIARQIAAGCQSQGDSCSGNKEPSYRENQGVDGD